MNIKIYISLLIAVHISLFCYSQAKIQPQEVKRISGKAYLISGGIQYEIRENMVIAKLKAGKEQVRSNIKILKSHSFGMLEIAVPKGAVVEEYVKELYNTNDFEYVDYDIYLKPCMNPNDTYFSDQWGPGHIRADVAWEITTGSPSIKVAVIDPDGFDLNHPDLYYGSDAYSNLSISEGVDYVSSTDHTPTSSHGTAVAGVIAAKTNNGTGTAGIAGGNNCEGVKVIPYRAMTRSQSISAIYSVVSTGAKIINISFTSVENSQFNNAITYAYNNGVSIICASGNDSLSSLPYPASHEYTIAVGSIKNNNNRDSDSNYGNGLDFVAPGVSIKCPVPAVNGDYDNRSGTSIAAPHVSGVVALMLSVNPSLTPYTIKNILRNTATKINTSTYQYNSNGWNEEVGYGLVNAYAAVVQALPFSGLDKIYNTSVYSIPNLPTGFTVTWSLTGDNASNFTLQNNTPSINQCTITRKEDVQFSGSSALTLSAQILCSGTPIITKTKSICAPYISGDSNPCLNELYSVEGYSTGEYVTWNLSGSGYSVIPDLVPTNTEGNNYLGVHRTASSQTYASGTITATISSGGNVLGTLTKKISSAAGFSGTWYQSSSLFPPYTPDDTPEDLQCGLHTFTSGKRIVMQSDDFIGATISGNAVISHNNSIVSFPTFSGTSFTINGYVSGTCKAYKFRFLAAVDPILPLDLSINSTGSGYIFSLLEKQQGDRSEENQSKTPYSGQWQLTIMQSETGQTMYNGTTDGQSITVNTSGWRRGLYVAVARVNDSTIAQKLAIEE